MASGFLGNDRFQRKLNFEDFVTPKADKRFMRWHFLGYQEVMTRRGNHTNFLD
jgi:hypothetical protein